LKHAWLMYVTIVILIVVAVFLWFSMLKKVSTAEAPVIKEKFVSRSDSVDPYIMKLRKKHLPQQIWDTGGPPAQKEVFYIMDLLKSDPENAELLYLLAWHNIMQKQYQEASDSIEKALKIEPSNEKALEMRAYINLQWGKYPYAIEQAEELLKKFPKNGFLWYVLGAGHAGDGHPERGIEPLKKAIKFSPEDPVPYSALISCYFEMSGPGDIQKGLKVFEKAIERFPYNQDIYLQTAENYLEKTGDLRQAIKLTNKILKLNSKNPRAYLMKGFLLKDMGKYDAARTALLRGLENGPGEQIETEILMELGEVAYLARKPDLAEKYFKKTIDKKQTNLEIGRYRAQSYLGLARINIDKKNLRKAEEYIDKAQKTYKKIDIYVFTMVEFYIRNGQPEKAREFLDKILSSGENEYDIEKNDIEFLKAKIYMGMGQDEKAEKHAYNSLQKSLKYNKKIMGRRIRGDKDFRRLMDKKDFQKNMLRLENK